MVNRIVREIYNCQPIVSSEPLYPLQKWYNQLIDKKVDEVTIEDVLRMIRQNVFVDLALLKAIEFLQNDVFAGYGYEGELLEKLSHTAPATLSPISNPLRNIAQNALKKVSTHEWSYDGEKEEFVKAVHSLLNKID